MWPCRSNSPDEGLESSNSLGLGKKQPSLLWQFSPLELHREGTGFNRQAEAYLSEGKRVSTAETQRHLQPSPRTVSLGVSASFLSTPSPELRHRTASSQGPLPCRLLQHLPATHPTSHLIEVSGYQHPETSPWSCPSLTAGSESPSSPHVTLSRLLTLTHHTRTHSLHPALYGAITPTPGPTARHPWGHR